METKRAPAVEARAPAVEAHAPAGLPSPAAGGVVAWLAPILGLLAIAVFSYLWAGRLNDSLNAYRSPIVEPLPAGAPLAPLTDGLVLLIVDGLRYDTAAGMAYLNELAGRGADAAVVGVAPSYSETTWTTLMTGASAQISGAPVFNETYETLRPIRADHLFAAATDAGRTTAVAGSNWWEKMIPAPYRNAGVFTAGSDTAADREIVAAAVAWLGNAPPDFLVVHVSNVDLVGETYGTAGSEYRMAAMEIESHLRAIAAGLDLRRQTLVVVADHGQIRRGGHGGAELASVTTRLVAAGKGIRPGRGHTLRQIDVAPTLAALLGCRVPARAEGQFADVLLAWDGEERARGWVELAKGRLALADTCLRGMHAPAGVDGQTVSQVRSLRQLLRAGKWDEAYGSAGEVVRALDTQMSAARRVRLARERVARLWLPLAYAALLGGLLWRMRRDDAPLPCGPALVAIAVYHALFLLGRNTYSFSMIASESQFLLGMAGRTLAGLLLGWLWLMAATRGSFRMRSLHPQMQAAAGSAHLRMRTPQPSRRAWQTLRFGWLVIVLLGIPIIGIAWWQGPAVTWTLPDFDAVFVLLMTLVQVLTTAGGTLLLAGAARIYELRTIPSTDYAEGSEGASA